MITIDASEVHALAADIRTNTAQVEPVAQRIIAKTALDVVATSQQLAPVDLGILKSSISADIDGLSFEAGPSVEYGIYQELGTSEMGAQPYLGPAFDRHAPRAVEALAQLGERILR
jgi:HK97 gp10 family phage protein